MATCPQIIANQGLPSWNFVSAHWNRRSKTSTLPSPKLPRGAVLCVGDGESDPLPRAVLRSIVWVLKKRCLCPVSQCLWWEHLLWLLALILLSTGLVAPNQPTFVHLFPLPQLNRTLPFSQNKATVYGTWPSRVLDRMECCLSPTHKKQMSASPGLD